MKILHVITGLEVGGAEMALYKLIASSPETEHVVMSIGGGGSVALAIEKLGVPVHVLSRSKLFGTFLVFFRLRKLVKSVAPDIVQSWMLHANFVAYYLCRYFYSKPLIWGVRCTVAGASATWLNRWITKRSAKLSAFPAKIVYNTHAARKEFTAIGYCQDNAAVVPNGFDVEASCRDSVARQEVRAELELGSDAFVIGCFARFDPMKNHMGLLEAFSQFVLQYPKSALLLAGTGVDCDNQLLVKKIADLGIKNSVKMLGRRDDVQRLLLALDIFCLPSVIEAFSNAQGEAMCAGIPCIVTDVGDGPEVLGDGGMVVPPGNVEALTAAMKSMSELSVDKLKTLGALARQRIVEYYSLPQVTKQFLSVYQAVAEKK